MDFFINQPIAGKSLLVAICGVSSMKWLSLLVRIVLFARQGGRIFDQVPSRARAGAKMQVDTSDTITETKAWDSRKWTWDQTLRLASC